MPSGVYHIIVARTPSPIATFALIRCTQAVQPLQWLPTSRWASYWSTSRSTSRCSTICSPLLHRTCRYQRGDGVSVRTLRPLHHRYHPAGRCWIYRHVSGSLTRLFSTVERDDALHRYAKVIVGACHHSSWRQYRLAATRCALQVAGERIGRLLPRHRVTSERSLRSSEIDHHRGVRRCGKSLPRKVRGYATFNTSPTRCAPSMRSASRH